MGIGLLLAHMSPSKAGKGCKRIEMPQLNTLWLKKQEMIDSVKLFYVMMWNKQFYFSNGIPTQLIVPLLLEQI